MTSAEVYGAHPDNEVPLPDHAPLRAVADDGFVGELLAVEEFVEESRANHPDVRFPDGSTGCGGWGRRRHRPHAVLRGAAPPGRQGRCARVAAVPHVDDLATGVVRVATQDLDGVPSVTVGSDGALTLTEVERLTAMRRIAVRETTATSFAAQLHRVILPAGQRSSRMSPIPG